MKNNRIILSTLAALTAQIIFGFSFMFTKISLGYAGAVFLDEKITLLCVGAILMIIVGVCGVQMADANGKK